MGEHISYHINCWFTEQRPWGQQCPAVAAGTHCPAPPCTTQMAGAGAHRVNGGRLDGGDECGRGCVEMGMERLTLEKWFTLPDLCPVAGQGGARVGWVEEPLFPHVRHAVAPCRPAMFTSSSS